MTTTMPLVRIERAESMNLLGLLLSSILTRRLAEPRRARRLVRLRGDVRIEGGPMSVTLRFGVGEVRVSRALAAAPVAVVRGGLRALLDVALGRSLFWHLLTGRLRARGRPLALWRLRALLRP